MTTTSLFSHADLQRHLTRADGDETMAPEEALGIIAVLVGLKDASETTAVAVIDGQVRLVNDPAALEDAACTGALVLAVIDEGVTVDVLGDPWDDLSAALLPFIEQGVVSVTFDAGAIMKLETVDPLPSGAESFSFNADQNPGLAWATGDWNGDGVTDLAIGFASAEGASPVLVFTGEVRMATGDVNGDGTLDLVATTATGDQFVFANAEIRAVVDDMSGGLSDPFLSLYASVCNDLVIPNPSNARLATSYVDGEQTTEVLWNTINGDDWFTATDDLWL